MAEVGSRKKRKAGEALTADADEGVQPQKRSRADRLRDAHQRNGKKAAKSSGPVARADLSGANEAAPTGPVVAAKQCEERKLQTAPSHRRDTPERTPETVDEADHKRVGKRRQTKRRANGKTGKNAGDQLTHELESSLPKSSENLSATKLSDGGARLKVEDNQETVAADGLSNESSWALSESTGGLFLDQDPILTADEQYLILPTRNSVKIYATQTSLLIKSLPLQKGNYISSCALSKSANPYVFVTTEDGYVVKWDWTTGEALSEWRVQEGLLRLFTCASEEKLGVEQILILYETPSGNGRLVSCLLKSGRNRPTRETTVLKAKGIFQNLAVLNDGEFLVTAAGPKLLLGHRLPYKDDDVPFVEYVWRELTFPHHATSLDAKVRSISKSATATRDGLDVVVGFADGTLQVYDDFLFKIIGKERNAASTEITSKRLHWHRNAVKTVKWSKDGNYLISGGFERVLVIWQLDTNQQQYLPHLSAAILNLTISAAGASYILRLADNSVMVLSTADLLPTTNIHGPSILPCSSHGVSAIIHPVHKNKLLVATPTSLVNQVGLEADAHSTMLQTYDWKAGVQLGKQALARNVATNRIVDPRGHLIQEPHVTFLAASDDGACLATIDEWMPHADDLEVLSSGDLSHRVVETCLKFWSWNEASSSWELITRVDEPHGQNTICCGLIACSNRLEFTTLGANGQMKVWKRKWRQRDGLAVKDKSGHRLSTWSAIQAVQVTPARNVVNPPLAVAAYSSDGTVVAASWSPSDVLASRPLNFVDPQTGSIVLQENSLISAGEARIGFVDRFLVILSTSLHIWHTITRQTWLQLDLAPAYSAAPGNLLATNPVSGQFAIALNPAAAGAGHSHIAVFDVESRACIYKHIAKADTKCLIADLSEAAYLVVDASGEICRLSSNSAIASSRKDHRDTHTSLRGLTDIFGFAQTASSTLRNNSTAATVRDAGSEGARPLDNLFRSYESLPGPPSVQETFSQLANLFAKRSTTS